MVQVQTKYTKTCVPDYIRIKFEHSLEAKYHKKFAFGETN